VAYHRGMRFQAPWDRTLRISTAIATTIAFAVVASTAIVLFHVTGAAGMSGSAAGAVVAFVLAATTASVGLAWALAPRGYSIEGNRLRVERPLRPVDVPLREIRAAGALPEGSLAGSLRVAGSGGLFGYYGRFWSRRLGSYRMYATRRTGLVVVDAADRFVLSPEPADRFLEDLLSRAPSASRAVPEAPLPPRPTPRRVKLGVAALVLLAPVVLGAVFLGVWALSPVSARVEGGEIRIERNLAPTVVIPLAGVRRAERLHLAYAQRLRRVAGTAIPGGVAYGHFRSPELGDVQLYAWRGAGYVLVDTAERRVVLTPEDPDAFLAAVRAAMARP
jgi:Bacterial PH domain